MPAEARLATFRAIIVAAFPELADQSFALAAHGWDSIAVDVGGRLIFKFPRHPAAEARLRKEARLLTAIRPLIGMPIPDMTLFEGPPPFSRHAKLAGDYLTPVAYAALTEAGRKCIAGQLAAFYAELHALDPRPLMALGAGRIASWLPAEEIARKAVPLLPETLRRRGREALATYDRLSPDPCGETFGFFDGHGWNLAFDAGRERLNGVYDFGDSGLGSLHREFIYSSLTAFDLTVRIIAAYEELTGRRLDRDRIDLLTGIHGLSELAEAAEDPSRVGVGVERVVAWLTRPGRETHKKTRIATTMEPPSIDAYIAASVPAVRPILQRIREIVRAAAPEAQEIISYRMPAFRGHGIVVYFAAFKDHIGLFPPVEGDAGLDEALAPYRGPKGNLRFPLKEPMPYALIERVVRLRAEQDRALAAARKPRRRDRT